MKKLRVGVVGVGHIGSNHARIYAEIPSAEFTAVYDVEPFRSRGTRSGAAVERGWVKPLRAQEKGRIRWGRNLTARKESPNKAAVEPAGARQHDTYLSSIWMPPSTQRHRSKI